MAATATQPVTLINVLAVQPGVAQQAVIDSLHQNTETVIMTLKGWISTTLVASSDGKRVIIHSHWDDVADIDAMRADPRMIAYFPEISEMASFDSMVGVDVLSQHR